MEDEYIFLFIGLGVGMIIGILMMGVILYRGDDTCIKGEVLHESCKQIYGEEYIWDNDGGYTEKLTCHIDKPIEIVEDVLIERSN